MKLSKSLLTIAALAIAFAPAVAHADTFTWSFASADVSASGILTATPFGSPGDYVITGGTGTLSVTGYATLAVSILPCADPVATCTLQNSDGAGANLTYDNLFYPSNSPGSELDGNGIVLTPGPSGVAGTGLGIWDGPSQEFFGYVPGGYENLTTPFTATLVPAPSAAPEPGSLVLLGTGLVGLATTLKRRR
jgi:hypothetical protein